jgi:hypothetical protein
MLRHSVFGLVWIVGSVLVGCTFESTSEDGDDGGCGSDSDCREGRICEDGECVDAGGGGTAGTAGTAGTSAGGTSAGGTAGTGGGGGATVEEHCTDLMTLYCGRAFDECIVSSADYAECVSTAVPACCTTRCADPSPATEAEIATCGLSFDGIFW